MFPNVTRFNRGSKPSIVTAQKQKSWRLKNHIHGSNDGPSQVSTLRGVNVNFMAFVNIICECAVKLEK